MKLPVSKYAKEKSGSVVGATNTVGITRKFTSQEKISKSNSEDDTSCESNIFLT